MARFRGRDLTVRFRLNGGGSWIEMGAKLGDGLTGVSFVEPEGVEEVPGLVASNGRQGRLRGSLRSLWMTMLRRISCCWVRRVFRRLRFRFGLVGRGRGCRRLGLVGLLRRR